MTRSRARHWFALAAIAGVAVAGVLWLGTPPVADAAIDSLAVLPFENASGDAEIGYLSDGVSESLINSLSQLPDVKVISRSSAAAAASQSDDLRRVAEQLGVQAVVTGRLTQRGGRVVVSAALIDARQDRQLWGDRYERELSDVAGIERELAKTIVARLRTRLTASDVTRPGRHTSSAAAYQLYMKGRHFIVGTTAEMDVALEAFQEAARLDPDYALAYASISESLVTRVLHGAADRASAGPAARAALDRAFAIDPDLPEAHAADALFRLYLDWDLTGSARSFQRALALAPGSAPIHLEHAALLWATERTDAALASSRRALELDPLGRMPLHNLGISHFFARDYEASAAAFRRALEVHPSWVWGYTKLGLSYALSGHAEQALAAAEKAESLNPADDNSTLRAWLGATYGRAGARDEARAAIERLHELALTRPVSAFDIATVYSQLGDAASTIAWLERALAEHSPWVPFIPPHVVFDELRDDPRFVDLQRRVEAAIQEAST